MNPISFDGTYNGWKRAAREALGAGYDPANVNWIDPRSEQKELALEDPAWRLQSAETPGRFRVPREFMDLARDVSCHRDDGRWARLYRALWRLTHDEPHLLDVTVDNDVTALRNMAKAVRRDVHKMRAFVRFREVATSEGTWFVAWFEPQHHIVEANAPFFIERFPEMRWSVLTPDRCAHWDLAQLRITDGADRSAAPREDGIEDLWRTYYASIFNPARIKVGAMTAEMPRHYWKNLPEAKIIPSLLAEFPARVELMLMASDRKQTRSTDYSAAAVPDTADVDTLRTAAAGCRACPLWRNATCVWSWSTAGACRSGG
jgi:uracil-DNA glycosylase